MDDGLLKITKEDIKDDTEELGDLITVTMEELGFEDIVLEEDDYERYNELVGHRVKALNTIQLITGLAHVEALLADIPTDKSYGAVDVHSWRLAVGLYKRELQKRKYIES